MKHIAFFLLFILLLSWFSGCVATNQADIAATTLPVYEFTSRLCQGTGLTVTRLVTERISCLHDYTLQVQQMRAIQSAQTVIISGAGLEEFLEDALNGAQNIVDASQGLSILDSHHNHAHAQNHGHIHTEDPHIWLSAENAKAMAYNICHGLQHLYPEHAELFSSNLLLLNADLDALQSYGEKMLGNLSCKELVTFHDGFSYLAESFGLTIVKAVEEESGSEVSAAQLKELILLVQDHHLPAIFVESNGATSAAEVIAAETGLPIFTLDMVMSGESYFDAMYHNIDTLREALQ